MYRALAMWGLTTGLVTIAWLALIAHDPNRHLISSLAIIAILICLATDRVVERGQ